MVAMQRLSVRTGLPELIGAGILHNGAAHREAKDDIAGPLRIVGPKSSFASILMQLLDAFCRTYPDIQPDVRLDDGIGNWVPDSVDVGFRIGA